MERLTLPEHRRGRWAYLVAKLPSGTLDATYSLTLAAPADARALDAQPLDDDGRVVDRPRQLDVRLADADADASNGKRVEQRVGERAASASSRW